MKIKLHHLNLCSKDVPGMEEFYRSVLDLAPEPSLNGARDTSQGYAAPVAFVTDGQTQMHLATRDIELGFRTNHIVKPLERGHIAFRTDDTDLRDAVNAALEQMKRSGALKAIYQKYGLMDAHQVRIGIL